MPTVRQCSCSDKKMWMGGVGLVRGEPARFADRRGWKALAESDSVLLVEQPRFGERRIIRSVRLQVRDAPRGDGAHWLVLDISGQSVDLRIPFDENMLPMCPDYTPCHLTIVAADERFKDCACSACALIWLVRS
jgi:hypothetical protein